MERPSLRPTDMMMPSWNIRYN